MLSKSLKMENGKTKWFKSNRTVKNLTQASDATLKFYYEKIGYEVEVYTQEYAPLEDTNFHGKCKLDLWGASGGFKEIKLLDSGSFNDSLMGMKIPWDTLLMYTHFIVTGIRISSEGTKYYAKIYRLTQQDRSQIITGYF